MIAKSEEEQLPRLTEMIVEGMRERGVTTLDLAKHLGVVYETVRRYVLGGLPSLFVLKEICAFLKLDYKKAAELRKADQINRKWGDKLPSVLAGKKPGMEPLERVWDDLTGEQQQDLIVMAQGWAKRNRTRRAQPEHETKPERRTGQR